MQYVPLVLNGVHVRVNDELELARPPSVRILWPAPRALGEYVAAVFRVRARGGLALACLKVLRVNAQYPQGKVRTSKQDVAELRRAGRFGFMLWHVPTGRTLSSRRVFTQTGPWCIDTFEAKAPDMRRMFGPVGFTLK